MAQLMPLPLTVSCFSKIQIGFISFWYRLTRVVPDKGPLNGCCMNVAVAINFVPTVWIVQGRFARAAPPAYDQAAYVSDTRSTVDELC